MNKNRPIAVIDSGLGGLTVYKELKKILPQEQFLFVGDNLNAPYGTKLSEKLWQCLFDLLTFLESQKVKMVVVACHTLSALIKEDQYVAKKLQNFSFPILGMVEASIDALIESNKKRCVIFGTLKTIQSNVYGKALANLQGFSTWSLASSQLATSIEENIEQLHLTEFVLQESLGLQDFLQTDCLLLACTHYPIVKELIERKLPKTVFIVDPAHHIAKKVFDFLSDRQLLADRLQKEDLFYLTKPDLDFARKMKVFLAKEIFVDFIPNQLK